MQLTIWQKIGIVLSIIWAAGAALHQHNDTVEDAKNFGALSFNTCADTKDLAHDSNLSPCEQEKAKGVALFMQGDLANCALAALVPIPFAWIAVYVFAWFGRALLIGLPAVIPWRSLSLLRKIFVGIAAATSVAAASFGVMTALSFYTDSLTPVVPSPFSGVSESGENLVVAQGTWSREGSRGEGSAMAFPLQTSKIYCMKNENRCVESKASVSGNALIVDRIEYDLESWSPTTIVFTNETPCAKEVFTIDRKTQAVNGVGHHLESNLKMCNMRFAGEPEREWKYHLVGGFKVYWDLRQKNRPAALRIIQAFFGN